MWGCICSCKWDFEGLDFTFDKACGDVCRLRSQSYDIHQYVNMSAKPFTRIYQEPKPIRPSFNYDYNGIDTEDKVADLCREISQQHIDLTGTYDDWMKIGAALSSLGESGRQWFHLCEARAKRGKKARKAVSQAERRVWPRKMLEVGWLFVKIVYSVRFCEEIWGLFG